MQSRSALRVAPLGWLFVSLVVAATTRAQPAEPLRPPPPASPVRDTDGDGIPDATEVRTGTEPLRADTDGDGVADGVEDADRDGVRDPDERDPRVPGLHHASAYLPEPMVFDMVRALGARAGEVEVNTLVVGDWVDQSLTMRWAPEVEWAIVDGFAVELELPMLDTELHALKLAAQLTLPSRHDAFAHGLQAIGEVTLDDWRPEGSLLYIAGLRVDRLSLIAMVGARGAEPATERSDWEVLVNSMVGVDLHETVTVAAEANVATALDGDVSVRLVPQLHWQVVQRFRIQLGAGATFEDDRWSPLFAARLILE